MASTGCTNSGFITPCADITSHGLPMRLMTSSLVFMEVGRSDGKLEGQVGIVPHERSVQKLTMYRAGGTTQEANRSRNGRRRTR